MLKIYNHSTTRIPSAYLVASTCADTFDEMRNNVHAACNKRDGTKKPIEAYHDRLEYISHKDNSGTVLLDGDPIITFGECAIDFREKKGGGWEIDKTREIRHEQKS